MCSVRHDAPCSRVLAVLDARSRRIRGFRGIDGPSQRAERVMLRKGFHGQAVGLILAALKGVVSILGQQPCSRSIFARFCCRQEAPRNPDQQICSRHRSQVSTGQQRQFRGHHFCAESLPLVTVAPRTPSAPLHQCSRRNSYHSLYRRFQLLRNSQQASHPQILKCWTWSFANTSAKRAAPLLQLPAAKQRTWYPRDFQDSEIQASATRQGVARCSAMHPPS